MKRKPTLTSFEDAGGEFRWQIKTTWKILDSTIEGFATRAGAIRNFIRIRDAMNQITDKQLADAGKAVPKQRTEDWDNWSNQPLERRRSRKPKRKVKQCRV